MKQQLDQLSRLGSIYQLSFSSQILLKDCLIGLDGIQRKLLVLEDINIGRPTHYVIDLQEVYSCTVKMDYGRIAVNGLRKRTLEQYLEKMTLHFELLHGKGSADIVFYRKSDHAISELPALEQQARTWKELLCKMLPARSAHTV